jgi:hypothetical protein
MTRGMYEMASEYFCYWPTARQPLQNSPLPNTKYHQPLTSTQGENLSWPPGPQHHTQDQLTGLEQQHHNQKCELGAISVILPTW